VHPIDPRLLRRARAARVLLAADVAIGISTAVLVLLQATLLARIIATSFEGAPLDEVSGELVLLVGVFTARGVLAWAFEVVGRRGAVGVLSQLRLELAHALAERGLRDAERRGRPAHAAGSDDLGEVAQAAGVDGHILRLYP